MRRSATPMTLLLGLVAAGLLFSADLTPEVAASPLSAVPVHPVIRNRPGWPWEPGAPRPTIGAQEGDDAIAGLDLTPSPNAPADRVVIISMDGLRPDAIRRASTPNLDRLYAAGAFVEFGETLRRSSTLPSHASMLTGVRDDVHGLRHNGYRPAMGRTRYPSIFRIARAAGVPTTMFAGKQKLAHIIRSEDVDHFEVGGVRCRRVMRVATPALETFPRGLAFVHLPDTDGAGHTHGWMTRQYMRAVERVDGCVGQVVQALAAAAPMDRTLLILTADHGGHHTTHGAARPSDMRIPWLAAGGVPGRSVRVSGAVHTMDTAATALAALGLPQPRGIEGRVIHEALGY